jgi:hypothetical protein
MKVIAINFSGIDNIIGDAFVVSMLVDESWFNTFKTFWSKKSLAIRLNRGVLFERLGVSIANHFVRRTQDTSKIPELIADCINSYKEFWDYKIYIETDDKDIANKIKKCLPERLHDKFDKTKILNTPHKSLVITWALADEYRIDQEDMIVKTWGNIGKNRLDDDVTKKFLGEHKDCPQIREAYRFGGKDETTTKQE